MLVCVNGVTQFVIEAKSLSQDIIGDYDFYKQTINYADSKNKAFAILTNFKSKKYKKKSRKQTTK